VCGFTKCDIQLQEGVVDCFLKHQQPQFLLELQSVQLFGDTDTSQKTSAKHLARKSLAVKSEPSQLYSLCKKKVLKASFVSQHCSTLSKLRHETAKSSGKSRLLSLHNMIKVLNFKLDVYAVHFVICTNFARKLQVVQFVRSLNHILCQL